jgi:glycosyltransferase involved in cell wall biosynthesis
MRILIATNMAPFVWGGAEELAVNLQRHLVEAGHDSEVLRIPFQWEPATGIPSQMYLARVLACENADRVIALKFPAYMIQHPHKTLWLLHQYRQAYDLFDTGLSNLHSGEAGQRIRGAVITADNIAFSELDSIYVNSEVTQRRLLRYNGIESTILPPPVNNPELFVGGRSEGYVFAGGRVNKMKRQGLLVRAVAGVPSCRLVIAGPADSPEEARELVQCVDDLGLRDQVTVDIRFLSRSEYAAYLNGAAAVAYLPLDEDSLGSVSMEAATARKPIITTSDSGGVLALVEDGVTGWVADPNVESLADALASAVTDPGRCESLGTGAHDKFAAMSTSWEETLERLLG